MKQKYLYTIRIDTKEAMKSLKKLKSVIEILFTKKRGIYEVLTRGKYLKNKEGLKILKVKPLTKKKEKKSPHHVSGLQVIGAVASIIGMLL